MNGGGESYVVFRISLWVPCNRSLLQLPYAVILCKLIQILRHIQKFYLSLYM